MSSNLVFLQLLVLEPLEEIGARPAQHVMVVVFGKFRPSQKVKQHSFREVLGWVTAWVRNPTAVTQFLLRYFECFMMKLRSLSTTGIHCNEIY
jgi:hypothetical protein